MAESDRLNPLAPPWPQRPLRRRQDRRQDSRRPAPSDRAEEPPRRPERVDEYA